MVEEKARVFEKVMRFGEGKVVFSGVLPFLPPGGWQWIMCAGGFAFALEYRNGQFRVLRSGTERGNEIILDTEEVDAIH